jgi:dCMP deaminase
MVMTILPFPHEPEEWFPPRPVPSWDDYYMGLVFFICARSKDPSTQVGAIVVNTGNRPLGMGYNGAPSGIPDEKINWNRPHKYVFIEHAEPNAIRHAASGLGSLEGATLYCTNMPCNECVRKIVIEKFARVVYGSQSANMMSEEVVNTTRHIAELGGVKLEPFTGNLKWVRERMNYLESYLPELFS